MIENSLPNEKGADLLLTLGLERNTLLGSFSLGVSIPTHDYHRVTALNGHAIHCMALQDALGIGVLEAGLFGTEQADQVW